MVVFFGTSPRSAIFLKKILDYGLHVDIVVSQEAKPLGKKQVLTENPVVSLAKELSLPCLESVEKVLELSSPVLGIILDYNQMIPSKIINHFQKGIINLHFSKLPAYRGPAPVQYTILNGDPQAWISHSLISEKLDQGKIIHQSSLDLDFTETTDSLYEKLVEKAARETPEIIRRYLAEELTPQPQAGPPSHTQKLTSANCQIDWSAPPEKIARLIRAAYSEPGAWTEVEIPKGKEIKILRLKVLEAHLEKEKLILDQVQLEGKKPVSWEQFLAGYPRAAIVRD